MLIVKDVIKKFKDKTVLKGVSFEIKGQEIVAILGRSGGGKTTLLRCINGLETNEQGTIQIGSDFMTKEENGKMIYANKQQKRAFRKQMGLVFQNYNLFPHLSVLENIIEAPVYAFGVSKDVAIQKARKLLEILDLVDKENEYPFQLSGGQKQRVAIARACALDPKILCLDEPTSALDPELTGTIAQTIRVLSEMEQCAVVLVTHDIPFVERIAERVIFLVEGEIAVDCSKDEFFQSTDKRIRSFISTMNIS